MPEIEWKTYIEPVRHVRAEVTEANALDFCREYGWALSYIEKKVAPFPDGRAMVMHVSGVGGAHRDNGIEVPFWVDMRGDNAYRSSAPRGDWKVDS